MLKRMPRFYAVLLAVVLLLSPALATAEIEIILKNAFIERYKDRATIEATYTVDKAHPRPEPVKDDGDIHVAGRSPDIGLATVAELMNARLDLPSVDKLNAAAASGTPLKIVGVWRFWTEHGGDSTHRQGSRLEPFDTTNPDHLALVSWRIRHAKERPEVLRWRLPYEIIIVGVYGTLDKDE